MAAASSLPPVSQLGTTPTAAIKLSVSPFADLRQRGEMFAGGNCPVCSNPKKSSPTMQAFECPGCGFPTHCSDACHSQDRRHRDELCGAVCEHNADLHHMRTLRTQKQSMPTLSLNVKQTQPCDLSSWTAYVESRGAKSPLDARVVRYMTAALTYPLTIAWQLKNALAVKFGDTATHQDRVCRIVVLGARAESTLPQVMWREMSRAHPHIHTSLQLVGPDVAPSAHMQSEFIDPRVKLTCLRTAYDKPAHERCVRDAFDTNCLSFYVGLNSGVGQPQFRSLWDDTLDIILKSGDPFLLTSFDKKDLDADIDAIKEAAEARGVHLNWWLEPTENPFRSLLSDVNVMNGAHIIYSSAYAFGVCGKMKEHQR